MTRIAAYIFVAQLIACVSAQERSMRSLAADIASAENKLPHRTIAVLLPQTRGLSDAAEGEQLTDRLIHELVRTSNLKVAERSRLGEVLKEKELAQSGIVEPAVAAKLGRLLTVDAVLIGTLTGSVDKTEIFLRLVDSGTALIIHTARAEILPAGRAIQPVPAAGLVAEKQPVVDTAGTAVQNEAQARRIEVRLPGGANTGKVETEPEASGKLVDVAYRKAGPGGYHQVIGRIANTGNIKLLDPRVSLQLFDRQKNLIGGSACVSPDQAIAPGSKLPFSCLFKPAPDYSYYEAVLDTSARFSASRATELSAASLRFRRDAGSISGDYQLSGQLTNREDYAVTYPRVLLSLFDANGRFIGSASGFTVKKELAPGESSPFVVTVYAYALHGKPVRYEAFYSALLSRR